MSQIKEIPAEKKNLETHVEICGERYGLLNVCLDCIQTDIKLLKIGVLAIAGMLASLLGERVISLLKIFL